MHIRKLTILKVSDNSGAKTVQCIGLYKSKKFASIGDIILVTVKTKYDKSMIKKSEVMKAIVIRTKYPFRRGGLTIRYSDNAVVLINDLGKKTIKGNRVFGSTVYEVKSVIPSITNLCEKVF
ncbi:50S ribosomal protein L14 [bacterium AB1]|nr:50S ribosomal protein L14 [bacterium AB1]